MSRGMVPVPATDRMGRGMGMDPVPAMDRMIPVMGMDQDPATDPMASLEMNIAPDREMNPMRPEMDMERGLTEPPANPGRQAGGIIQHLSCCNRDFRIIVT